MRFPDQDGSDEEERRALVAESTAAPGWPGELAPQLLPYPKPPASETGGWRENDPLPPVDIVVITWTTDELEGLQRVLVPTLDHRCWYQYTRDFYKVHGDLFAHRVAQWHELRSLQTPSLNESRGAWYRRGVHGRFCTIQIGDRRVLLFRSGLHMNTDGRNLPLVRLLEQILAETGCYLLLSVGTSGGVRSEDRLGDVVVTNKALFHLSDELADAAFNHECYTSSWKPACPPEILNLANGMMIDIQEEDIWLPAPHYRTVAPDPLTATPSRSVLKIVDTPVVTTDRFDFGTTTNGLGRLGCAVEMGDALVARTAHCAGVPFGLIRNISDPVMNGRLQDALQGAMAADIYYRFGTKASRNSAIAVWAVIAGEVRLKRPRTRPQQAEPAPEQRMGVRVPEQESPKATLPTVQWAPGEPAPETLPLPGPPEHFQRFSKYQQFDDWQDWAPLPQADAVVLVWSVEAFEALQQVFCEGVDTPEWVDRWRPYKRNAQRILRELLLQHQLQRDSQQSEFYGLVSNLRPEGLFGRDTSRAVGRYRPCRVGERSVLLFYCPLSIRTDGATLPVERLLQQALDEAQPRLVLSVGAAGATREAERELGTVLLSNKARLLLGNEHEGHPDNGRTFGSNWAPAGQHLETARRKLRPVAWPALVAPSVNYQLGDDLLVPPAQEPRIRWTDEPVITAPRRINMGFFDIELFELGTATNNLDLLGCAVELNDALVAKASQDRGLDCGFVRAIAVPMVNRGRVRLQRSWAQLFERECSALSCFNAAVAAWAVLAEQ